MQSGKARTKEWFLDYEPEQPREIEPLMGWTASGDMRQQVRLSIPPRRRLPIVSATRLRTRFSIPNPTSRASSPTLIIFHSSALSPGRIDAAGREAGGVVSGARAAPAPVGLAYIP
jgi:hypothetical protein